MYRENRDGFTNSFNAIYPLIQDHPIGQVWHERLNFQFSTQKKNISKDWIICILASLFALVIAKLPVFLDIDEDFFYTRNSSFIVLPILFGYFLWKQHVPGKKWLVIFSVLLISILFINFFPNSITSDTLVLSCIHLPLFLWVFLGYSFLGNEEFNYLKRIQFLRYNGNVIVMTVILMLAGVILTGITLGLFNLINVSIESFYFEYVVIWGLAASPIFATHLVYQNPNLVGRVGPIIAKLFTPLVFLTLVVYLIAVIQLGKNPYNDREFLLVFNALLIGVLALIYFSIAENNDRTITIFSLTLLISLSAVTVIINGIAMSAICFRISNWGLTPNRLTVLGSNLLILINLCIICYRFISIYKNPDKIMEVEKSIVSFLPIYGIWTMLVTFVLPFLFQFS